MQNLVTPSEAVMNETNLCCPACGKSLPRNSPQGLCPNCLGQLAEGSPRDSFPAPDSPSALTDTILAEVQDLSPCPDRGQVSLRGFGDYELIEEIARGGMGIVYRARQRSLNRIVAIKMILAGHLAGKQAAQRFRGEAAAAGILQHPNIVAIHEIGMHEGQHFFSMDLVEGQNLAQLVGNRPLSAPKAARYVKLIAEAIHYAHKQGILHRDLKPSNVLVDAANDQPRVTDFGLAKRLDGESSITVTGQVLGSPNFMPPEQASGTRGKVGRHSDVYGLARRHSLFSSDGSRAVSRRDAGDDHLRSLEHRATLATSAQSERTARSGDHLSQMSGERPCQTLRHGPGTRRGAHEVSE